MLGRGLRGGGPGRPPCWRTLKESRKGLGSVSLKNKQPTHTPRTRRRSRLGAARGLSARSSPRLERASVTGNTVVLTNRNATLSPGSAMKRALLAGEAGDERARARRKHATTVPPHAHPRVCVSHLPMPSCISPSALQYALNLVKKIRHKV